MTDWQPGADLCFGEQYWDSITKEDLEFSVGTKTNVWEVKEPLLDDADRRATIYDQGPGPGSDYGSSTYHNSNSNSNRHSQGYYDGGRY